MTGPWPRRVLAGLTAAYLAVLLGAPVAALVGNALSEGVWALVFALADPDAWGSLKLSLLLALAATVVNTAFGTAAAWVLARHPFPGRRFLTALVDLPFAVPPMVAGYMLLLILGRQGYLRWIVVPLGLEAVFSSAGMLLAMVFVTSPLVLRQVGAALQASDRREEDAAFALGAGPWDVFRRVTFPSIRWAVLSGAALTFARSLGEFGSVYVVGGVLRGYNETAPLFLSRALDDRRMTAVGGTALALAGLSFLVMTGIGEYRRHSKRGEGT